MNKEIKISTPPADLSAYLPLVGGIMLGHIYVGTDSSYDLGSTTKYWANIFSDAIYFNSTAILSGATAGKVDITGELATTGDINASTNGSSTSVPRVFGYKDLSSGEACRFQFGDEHNGFQNAYANDTTIYAYWGVVLSGGRQNYNAGFLPPSFTKTTTTGVLVLGENDIGDDPGAGATDIVTFAVQGPTSQTNPLTQWRDSTTAVHVEFNVPTATVPSILFNKQLADLDFVIAGDTEANLFRVDAGIDEIRMGDWDTNYSAFEKDGTLKMVGDATVFKDLQFPISNAKVPASNAPTWETFTANTNEYGFGVDDYIDTQANEVLHSWKLGTIGHVHLHITTKAANATGNDRFVKFTVVVAYCDTGETWQESSFTAELTIPDGTSALEQFYLDMGDLNLTNYIEEAEVRCRVTRIATTGGTEYSGNIFITQVGIHLENDTIGTRQENAK